MKFFNDMFTPDTSEYNAAVKAANSRRLSMALRRNLQYTNRGAAFRAAKWGSVTDTSIVNSNVHTQALQNQYAAFQGFENFARTEGSVVTGPTGHGSRAAEKGRKANYMALLAKRQDIENNLKESFGAAYYSQLHQNAVRQQNKQMAARDKLGIRPPETFLAKEKHGGFNLLGGMFRLAGFRMGFKGIV